MSLHGEMTAEDRRLNVTTEHPWNDPPDDYDGEGHPALYPMRSTEHAGHFVPEGWEELDRGLCPCGEAVRWNETTDSWDIDRSIRVLVLTAGEAETVADRLWRSGSSEARTIVPMMLDLQASNAAPTLNLASDAARRFAGALAHLGHRCTVCAKTVPHVDTLDASGRCPECAP